jgi:hypothetical protein
MELLEGFDNLLHGAGLDRLPFKALTSASGLILELHSFSLCLLTISNLRINCLLFVIGLISNAAMFWGIT